ncbi:cobalt ECF transporter T component CbiQ [Mycobacterium sp. ACS4331]|uniref:cobalt ECF transporter T component CbiQ n=1 Tax=Mycobacterium sp. ACS4331 TaxID=1834121 RepID=UPI0007FD9548|nr:cobalt ECF transporter T component CbiQ [Mycobacterium sp. ACS4331]OBF22548.1 cobalt ECF transporter T component CbiQ [Mycobacterium sp. ACS4331]
MGAGHSHPLYRDGHSPVHRAPGEVKIVCLVVFLLAVVATPRDMFWPYALYALIVVAVWRWAHIPLRWVLPRMLIEAPFVVLAVLLPFAEGGERVQVAGLQLSVAGLWAAWGIVVKGTLGVAAALTVAATTTARQLPHALSRLGVPALVTSMLVLMLRYIDVLAAEAARMRMARISRGDSPRTLHQAGAIARSVGVLFLRSYERGERVYLAMLSRGFDGRVPDLAGVGAGARATANQWVIALLPAAGAVAVAAAAWGLR